MLYNTKKQDVPNKRQSYTGGAQAYFLKVSAESIDRHNFKSLLSSTCAEVPAPSTGQLTSQRPEP